MNVDPRLVGAILQNDFCSFIRAIFPVVSPGAAISNAVANAIGVRVPMLPLTPARVLAALGEQKGENA